MNKMKTPVSYYGGKQSLLKYILPVIPEHSTYTESFTGGGAVFFAKEPAKCEVINDVNKEITNFYYVAQVKFADLKREVTTTLHAREAYNDAKVVYTYPHLFDQVKRAWAFYTITNQSFSSNMSSFGFDRIGTTSLKVLNKRAQFAEQIRERLARTTIENDDAVKVITRYDREEAFHYVDPPYFNSDCGHYKGYTIQDFERLLKALSQVKGKFLLSSYPSDILKEYQERHGWDTVSIEKHIAVSKHVNRKKTEVLTANYPIRDTVQSLLK